MSDHYSASSSGNHAVVKGAFDRVRQSPTLGEVLESDELSRALLEAARWPQGPECLRCGALGAACKLTTRPGLWTCKSCRNCQYSVTSGTPLHGTRVTLQAWVSLFHTQEVRRQRPSVSQVSRRLGVSYLTAKSMLRRLDELRSEMPAMAERMRHHLIELSAGRESGPGLPPPPNSFA
ncbi:MAG: transposase [Parvibaculum sp.]|uniref:transposase n=1 Tax=Parvibaculum sp. TaxID=2024848 RepID=UPI0028487CD9|nr:transposase [Parvibaculum sp.]MDR3499076.1 transposase [Parvibaculum sp.]